MVGCQIVHSNRLYAMNISRNINFSEVHHGFKQKNGKINFFGLYILELYLTEINLVHEFQNNVLTQK